MPTEKHHQPTGSVDPGPADVIIVGGGLAGSLAAILLARANVSGVLIDPYEAYPPSFRSEQLVGEQVETVSRLGMLDILVGQTAPAHRATAVRGARRVGGIEAPHYGIRYEDLVNRARAHLPGCFRFLKQRVLDIQTGPDRQRVTLADGTQLESRLVVIGTGLGQRLLTRLGIGRTVVRPAQSLTFGFDVAVAQPALLNDGVLVAYGERPQHRIDYLTIFAIDQTLRANLFTFGDRHDPLTRNMLHRPQETLREVMPSLERHCGRLLVTGLVSFRVNDLAVASSTDRDGVILVGDAFQTPCPAAGTGVGRLLTDIDRLCNHFIPTWLATPGSGAAKIGQFYSDPVKRRCDAEALHAAHYRRAFRTETSLSWRVHRQRVALQNKLRLMLSRRAPDASARGVTMAPSPAPSSTPHLGSSPFTSPAR